MEQRVAGVVVLFDPAPVVVENVRSSLHQVDLLVVVDNSAVPVPAVVEPLMAEARVRYLPNGANLGVARALNIGAEQALAEGCALLLTLDQDSRALPGMLTELLTCQRSAAGPVGLTAPFLVTRHGGRPPQAPACQPVATAMTSGSLLDLAAYRAVGPFREEFFIDFVDIEYSLRLRRAGYRLLRANGALLEHAVGHGVPLAGGLTVTSHPPLRKYYKTRNRLQVWKEYGDTFPGFCWRDGGRFILELLRLLLFEPGKGAKLRMLQRGIHDFRCGRFGPYREECP
jgi:rhamnosyltransferase